jgi:hypothetical protein
MQAHGGFLLVAPLTARAAGPVIINIALAFERRAVRGVFPVRHR